MGRAPCCDKVGLKKGRWTSEEDDIPLKYIATHGEGSWRSLPKKAGLLRCGKSCRLRWINYLRADLKRGNISKEEEDTIIKLHASLGNRWSQIASHMPGRTDNEIKNYWNSHLSRRVHTYRKPTTSADSDSTKEDVPAVTTADTGKRKKASRVNRGSKKKASGTASKRNNGTKETKIDNSEKAKQTTEKVVLPATSQASEEVLSTVLDPEIEIESIDEEMISGLLSPGPLGMDALLEEAAWAGQALDERTESGPREGPEGLEGGEEEVGTAQIDTSNLLDWDKLDWDLDLGQGPADCCPDWSYCDCDDSIPLPGPNPGPCPCPGPGPGPCSSSSSTDHVIGINGNDLESFASWLMSDLV